MFKSIRNYGVKLKYTSLYSTPCDYIQSWNKNLLMLIWHNPTTCDSKVYNFLHCKISGRIGGNLDRKRKEFKRIFHDLRNARKSFAGMERRALCYVDMGILKKWFWPLPLRQVALKMTNKKISVTHIHPCKKKIKEKERKMRKKNKRAKAL